MAPFSPIRSRHPIRVVLSTTAFLPFMSVRKAAALAIAQFGIAAFFIPGLARVARGRFRRLVRARCRRARPRSRDRSTSKAGRC
jgi:hypothetical protein